MLQKTHAPRRVDGQQNMDNAGRHYGPKCAQRLGLIPAQPRTTKTRQKPVKRAGRIIENYPVAISVDGQVEMFEGFTA